MRWSFFVVCLCCGVFLGCATVKQAKSNYDACVADASCMAKMVKNHDVAESVVKPIVDAVAPGVGTNPLTQVAGFLASMLTGVFIGGRLKKPSV